MKLNYQIFGETGPTMLIVHGLFGSIANWRAVAREFSKDYRVFVVDQRNHGDSEHADSMTYFDMAADLDEFVRAHQLSDFILCGHSMGGKAAMAYALSNLACAQRLKALIVLDIAPVVYTHSHAPYLQSMLDIDLNSLNSRADADQQLKAAIPNTPTRLFLMQSLVRQNERYRWKLNLSVLKQYMPEIVGFPEQGFERASAQMNSLFLHGSQSDYVSPEMHDKIKEYFPNAQFDSVKAGHWLHVEQRDAMIQAIRNFLSQHTIALTFAMN